MDQVESELLKRNHLLDQGSDLGAAHLQDRGGSPQAERFAVLMEIPGAPDPLPTAWGGLTGPHTPGNRSPTDFSTPTFL
jgi:hypothetical protein